MAKSRKPLFTASQVRKTQGARSINFAMHSARVKKPSTAALRDLIYYLTRKTELEKRYSKSDITFP